MRNLIELGGICVVVTLNALAACGSADHEVALRHDGGDAGAGAPDASRAGQGGNGLSASSRGGEPSGGAKATPSEGGRAEASGGDAGGGASGSDKGGAGGSALRVPGRGAVQIAVGSSATCVVLDTGRVRCWGVSNNGQLGHGDHEQVGDDEIPFDAPDVNVGGTVKQVVAGLAHVCALLETGAVRCWGRAAYLGYASTEDIGDDESPASAGDVDVGGKVIQLAASERHTCALLVGGTVRCWGWGGWGELGYGNTEDVGDDETPASAGDVEVGGPVTQIAAGSETTCALLASGAVRCWGGGGTGGLGYGHQVDIGDDEAPATAGDVNVGGIVTVVAAGASHTCVLLSTGNVRCWGEANDGRLGYGNPTRIGDDEAPFTAGDLDIGGEVTALAVGGTHNCALLVGGSVRCWGAWNYGSLGYGNSDNIGDDETPADAGDVNVGGPVKQLAAGGDRTCALLTNSAVRCWGDGALSILGYPGRGSVGDDETPASVGDVLY